MPLVACEQCRAQVSDVAETCPACGHPQPLHWTHKGIMGGPCERCRTFNLITGFAENPPNCRGCGRPLLECNPGAYLDREADQVCRNARDTARWLGGLIAGVLFILAVIVSGRLVKDPDLHSEVKVWAALGAGVVYLVAGVFIRQAIWAGGYTSTFSVPSPLAAKLAGMRGSAESRARNGQAWM